MKRCTCTYETLVKRGFSPIGHSKICKLSENKEPDKETKLNEESLFKEEWLDKDNEKKFNNSFYTKEKIEFYKNIGSKSFKINK